MAIATATAAEAGPSNAPVAQVSAAQVFKRLHPRSYLAQYLDSGYRPDGRKVGEWRDVSVVPGSISTANGSALVRLGNTTVLCGVTAETAAPALDASNAGFIVPNVDLPALASPRFKPGPPGDEAQRLSVWLRDLLVESNTIDPADLVISPGRAVWVLYIDLVCINYDGNAWDAAVLACMAALRDTQLPRATWSPTTLSVLCTPPPLSAAPADLSSSASSHTKGHTLPLRRTPLTASFALFGSAHLLPDPTAFEAPFCGSTLSIALDEDGRGCGARGYGPGGMSGMGDNSQENGEAVWRNVWARAEGRVSELREVLERAVPFP